MAIRFVVAPALLCVTCVSQVFAQAALNQPVAIGDVVVSGSLRSRAYGWDWFGGNANGSYTYPGSLFRIALSESKKTYDWQVEVAVPFILGLPVNAVAPNPQGQMGLGAAYFAANNGTSNASTAFIKQASIRFIDLGRIKGQSLKAGRMEFNDGTEVTPRNAVLAALKRDRISQRLLGTFGFSDVGRSFDGIQYSLNRTNLNVTFLGARPTRGVYQVNGWGELNVNVYYGALTGQLGKEKNNGEWRVFGLGYQDYRDNVIKTDNRPLAVRRMDAGSINIGTFGGHYVRILDLPAGVIDTLFWGAVQAGSWGALAHRAVAFAAEAGWQPPVFPKLAPWLRGGYNYGSGDSNPNDRRHGTFFQVLPTPRVYARFPFFNMMNTADGFGELIVRPLKDVTLRADVHTLRLADRNDLWYSGGGAFQPGTFGYTGRPSKVNPDWPPSTT